MVVVNEDLRAELLERAGRDQAARERPGRHPAGEAPRRR
jgi:hypothetical protein